jgi:hypothetical protein
MLLYLLNEIYVSALLVYDFKAGMKMKVSNTGLEPWKRPVAKAESGLWNKDP